MMIPVMTMMIKVICCSHHASTLHVFM